MVVIPVLTVGFRFEEAVANPRPSKVTTEILKMSRLEAIA
jgi:hypothetical protein